MTNAKLDECQAWSLSEVLGIGRVGKAEGLMEGDVKRLCVFSDYDGPTWSQIRMRNAMTTYRSIHRMESHTLPKKMMTKLGDDNVLATNILRKLGGGKLNAAEKKARISLCTSMNSTKSSIKNRWKNKLRSVSKVMYKDWVNKLRKDCVKEVTARRDQSIELHLKNNGLGTAYLMSLADQSGPIRTITHLSSSVPAKYKMVIRRLKAGMIPHLLVLQHMFDSAWHKRSFQQQLDCTICQCGMGVQDVQHIIEECGHTEHLRCKLDTTITEARDIPINTVDRSPAQRMGRLASVLHMPIILKMTKEQEHTTEMYGKAIGTYMKDLERQLDLDNRSPAD